MKILFDHLCFWQKYGGVPLYFSEIIKRLSHEDYILTVKLTNNEYLRQMGIPTIPFLNNYSFKGKARLESELGKLLSIPSILTCKYDIYHQTHYDPYAYKWLPSSVRSVTTIHDLNFFSIPEYYPIDSKLKRDMIESIHCADHIITISQNSKNDLCNYLNCPDDKISVIYHGVDKQRFAKPEEVLFNDDYILFVGARNQYKNFANLVKAFAILKDLFPSLKLVCAGSNPTRLEMELISSCKIVDQVKFIQCSDKQLVSLYQNALLFVYPSFYEGFGLPILEAMASGCPVVLSDASCFPEIAGNAALYFNPHDVDNIAYIIKKILYSNSIREKMINDGFERIEEFSWDLSVAKHIEVYKSLI